MPILILDGDYAEWITRMLSERCGVPISSISPETRLLHDLRITGDDADEFLTDYVDAFQVDMGGFKFLDHFTTEPSTPDFAGWQDCPLKPIKVRDLAEAASRKKWEAV